MTTANRIVSPRAFCARIMQWHHAKQGWYPKGEASRYIGGRFRATTRRNMLTVFLQHTRNFEMNTSLLNGPVALIIVVLTGMSLCVNEAMAVPIDTPSIVWSTPVTISTEMSAMSKDGRRVLYFDGAGAYIGRVIVVDVGTGSIAASFNINVDRHQGRDEILSMHFLNDTSFIVVTSWSFYVMDSRTGKLIEDVGLPPTRTGITYVAPMYNTDKMIIGAYRSLYKYDYKTKQMDTIYTSRKDGADGHTGEIGWIGLSDDERTVYSAGSRDFNFPVPGRVCAWDLATGKQLYQVDEPDSVYLQAASKATHGNFFAALGINKAVAYDLRTGTLMAQYYDVFDGSQPETISQGVGVSRDGSVIAIQGNRMVAFYTTKNPHLFANMNAWPASEIHFLDDGTSDVVISGIDTLIQRVRLNLSTSVNGDASSQSLQCSISPNPSSSQATLHIMLGAPCVVGVSLAAMDGRVISERSLGLIQAGSHAEVLQAQPGYYMCTVTAGSDKQSLPVIIR